MHGNRGKNLRVQRGQHLRSTPIVWSLAFAVCSLTACSLDGLISNEVPPDIADPARVRTPEGAVQSYMGAVVRFRAAFGGTNYSYIVSSATLTDEIGSDTAWLAKVDPYDGRTLPEYDDPALEPKEMISNQTYGLLQLTRNTIREAIMGLRVYAPNAPSALAGHLFALQGYVEILLADLYCSGIPLSTLDFDGDYTLMPGSSTEAVYTHAVALFDSALALSADSVRIHSMATIGKARALLALGRFAEAGTLARTIPDGFLYRIQYPKIQGQTNFAWMSVGTLPAVKISDRAGIVGYAYATGGDPRTPVIVRSEQGRPVYYPAWLSAAGDSALTLAGFVEARLIEAEAELQAGQPTWLSIVNALRTNGQFTTQPNASNPAKVDTLWQAGTGGVARLRPLEDPGTQAARVDIIFKERAFWMMLTGHRQGDARRLIRQYRRSQATVYPSGAYPGGAQPYGSDVTAPIPAQERQLNPLFTGCINREA